MYFCERGIRDGVQIYTCIIILREPRPVNAPANRRIPQLSPFPSPFPSSLNMFIRMFYAARAIMQFAYRIRAGHLSWNVSFVLLTNLPGPARVLAPYRMERFQSGEIDGREREREKERKSKLVSRARRIQRRIPTKKEASFWINNGNATGLHFPASNRSLSRTAIRRIFSQHVASYKTITLS